MQYIPENQFKKQLTAEAKRKNIITKQEFLKGICPPQGDNIDI